MNRRAFVSGLGALLTVPLGAEAEQKAPKIGVINANAPAATPRFPSSFWERLGELGWTQSQNLAVELRGAGGQSERAESIAAELVQLKVNIIVMDNGTFAGRVREKVTQTVPICVTGGDLQFARAVANLAKPDLRVPRVARGRWSSGVRTDTV